MDAWDHANERLRAANGRVDDALRRKDQRAFVLACQDRRRALATLTRLTLDGVDREPYREETT